MLFTAEHEEVRRSLSRFIASEINPHVDRWEAEGAFTARAARELTDACLQYWGGMGHMAETPVSRPFATIA